MRRTEEDDERVSAYVVRLQKSPELAHDVAEALVFVPERGSTQV